jgi:catechol 1,2-dioxygenase
MSESDLTALVLRRLDSTPNPRLRDVMQSLVAHLHAFAREVRLTESEWLAGVRFLTAAGHATDDVRQEFILLSDTLGLSSLVDLIDHGLAEPGPTEPTILGPFYVPGSPRRAFGESMVEYDDGGAPAVLVGRVLTTDGAPIPNAELDVWQNAATGFYAVQQPGVQPPNNLRGRYLTRTDGAFRIATVRPVPYPIPDDGPVGRLLNDTGRHPWRAAHVHLIVSAPGFAPLVTHVFDSASDYLDSDTVFGVKPSLVCNFVADSDGVLVCHHDVVLRRFGSV